MPATGPSSEHFGWPSFYEDPEAWWSGMERMRLLEEEGTQEERAQQAALTALRILDQRGLLRRDRLSYTRICQLEHETGIFTGSWTEFLQALHEAELKDRELWNSTS
jgi:hypothetical protein